MWLALFEIQKWKMANYVSKLIHIINERNEKWQTMCHMIHTKYMQMG